MFIPKQIISQTILFSFLTIISDSYIPCASHSELYERMRKVEKRQKEVSLKTTRHNRRSRYVEEIKFFESQNHNCCNKKK